MARLNTPGNNPDSESKERSLIKIVNYIIPLPSKSHQCPTRSGTESMIFFP